jgi:hypothetical protein
VYAHQHHGKIETAQAAVFHAGAVHSREDPPWLGDVTAELLGFPGSATTIKSTRFHKRSHSSAGVSHIGPGGGEGTGVQRSLDSHSDSM